MTAPIGNRRAGAMPAARWVLALGIVALSASAASGQWTQMSGAARDIGIGGGRQWVVGTGPTENGNSHVYRFDGGANWTAAAGPGGVRIAVGPAGMPWVVRADGAVARWTGSAWLMVPLPGVLATDIGVSPDVAQGSEFVVAVTDAQGNIWQRFEGRDWERIANIGANFERVAVGSRGGVWAVASGGAVYYRPPGLDEFIAIPGVSAGDVAVSRNGHVWAVGRTMQAAGGSAIYQWRGDSWLKMPGEASHIAVEQAGNAWVVSANNGIYQWPSDRVLPRPSPAGRIEFFNEAGYVARYSLSYMVDYGPRKSFSTGNITLGRRAGFNIPRNATDIRVSGEGHTGFSWSSTFAQSFERPTTVCFKSYGTTLSQRWNNSCSASVTKDDIDKVLEILSAIR